MDRRTFLQAGALWSAAAASGRAAWAQGPTAPTETFRYSVGWRGITGARAVLSVDRPSPETRRFTADVENTALLMFVFRIRDRFQAVQSTQTGQTLKTFLWQNENGNRRYREETFLADHVVSTERHGSGERTLTIPFQQRPLDPVASLFWLREQPLAVGLVARTPVFANNRVFGSVLRVQAQENISALGRTLPAYRILVAFERDGKPVDGAHGTFWISADERRLPLRAQAETGYGPVTGILTEHRS